MKRRFHIGITLLCVMLLAMMTSCKAEPFFYTFRQDQSNIEKVEICSYDHDAGTREALVELSEDDANALLSELAALECHKFFPLDPILSYGDIIICITYSDCEVEMIGSYNIGWIEPNGKLTTTLYSFNLADIRNLITKYVDADILANASKEF